MQRRWGVSCFAALDDAALDKFLSQFAATKITKFTLTDKSQLRRAILNARKAGYALADQEAEIGFRSIAIR